VDPNVTSETYIGSHQRLDGYKVQALKYSE
jgi:hypothetical protein